MPVGTHKPDVAKLTDLAVLQIFQAAEFVPALRCPMDDQKYQVRHWGMGGEGVELWCECGSTKSTDANTRTDIRVMVAFFVENQDLYPWVNEWQTKYNDESAS